MHGLFNSYYSFKIACYNKCWRTVRKVSFAAAFYDSKQPFLNKYTIEQPFYVTGLDQYMAVIFPLEYTTRITSSFSWQMMSTVWVLGALAAVPGALQMISAGNTSPWFTCRNIILSITEVQYGNENTLSTSTPSQAEVSSSTDYLVSQPNFPYEPNSSFIISISYSVRCWLAAISVIFSIIPILTLGYMYIRIFLEASKSGRDNRRR